MCNWPEQFKSKELIKRNKENFRQLIGKFIEKLQTGFMNLNPVVNFYFKINSKLFKFKFNSTKNSQ